MKSLFTFLLITLILQSCAYKAVPLKGTYQNGAVKSKVDLSFERTWENAIATWNLRVKSLDNASSVISVKLHTIRIERPASALQFKGLSTGNFEKWMIDEIVKGGD